MKINFDNLSPEAAAAFRGRHITNFLTDSRSLSDPAGTLFFAISTATNQGVRYIPWLYSKGVRSFVVPREYEVPEEIAADTEALFLRVEDPLKALQKAASRPDDYSGEIIAVTGSRGKTVVKEWLYQMLEPLRHTVRSPRSFNSQIGVPLSMTGIAGDTEVAVIEAGISRSGEMQTLTDIIQPDTVLLTNVGEEHDEGFVSRAAKADEKLSLMLCPRPQTLIYCADDEVVRGAVDRLPHLPEKRLVGWTLGSAPAAYRLVADRDFEHAVCRLSVSEGAEPLTVELEASCEADVQNGCHVLAYMLAGMSEEGYTAEDIRSGFSRLHPIATRLNVSEGSNGCSVVYDSYTSDVSSLEQALDFVSRRRMPAQSITVIMSDPRHELAQIGGPAHLAEAVVPMLERRGVSRFVGIGPAFQAVADEGRLPGFGGRSEIYPSEEAYLRVCDARDFRSEIILLKGAPDYHFSRILEMLEARTHETVLEVNLDALVRNFNYFRSYVPSGTGMIAMVKASGYGAGSYEIAKTLQDAGAAYLAVAVLDEGIDLRRNGITMPIMVMNPKVANYRMMFANRLEPEIYTFSMLKDVIEAARRHGVTSYPLHIKLDTGMHRMGFVEEEIPRLMEIINGSPEIRIATAFSHLATADCPDMDDYTERQLSTFRRVTDRMLELSVRPFKRHLLNSAGILRYSAEHHYDFVRLGIGLYGVNTLPPEMERPLELVSTLRTVVIEVRDWKAGETIGYGRRGVLKRDSRIATVPIGYADGMNRHFGNGAVSVWVNGHKVPTIGNICMDACMLDVTGVDVHEGDSVEIFGPREGVQHLADLLDTIPYEILTSVSPRVKRVYYRE